MNYLKFECPHCKQKLEAPENLFGKIISCPICKGSIRLPNNESVFVKNIALSYKNTLKNEYDKIVKKFSNNWFFTEEGLSNLPNILQDGERLLAFVSGLIG